MDLRYPVGQFSFAGTLFHQDRAVLIDEISATPD
jgi:hypothetical protein